MARTRFRSLYWRIALGSMLCVATVLAIQGAALLWMIARANPESRTNFTLRVANDLAHELEFNADVDVDRFVRDRYPTPPRSFYVVMVDGTVSMVGEEQPQRSAVDNVIRVFGGQALTAIPRDWEIAPYWAAPILVRGFVTGTVAVVPQNLVREIGPPMAVLAATLFIAGSLISAQYVFAPAHRRLKALENTSKELGEGHLDARAEVEGTDEVSALAVAFNQMAGALAEADQIRRSLLADVSHELMTPLTAIRGYQERLAAHPMTHHNEELARPLSIIGEEARRLERIIRELLDLARLESPGASLECEDVAIESLLGRVAERHGAEVQRRKLRLFTNVAPGAEIVQGDAFRLEQALQNLTANAIRHVPEGGVVSVDARLIDKNIVLTVRDNGSGIDDEHLPFIFNRFYKADASRGRATAGSGLGLSIVKAIVERHGGHIAVSSTPGVNTTFTVQFPASAAS